MLVKSQLQRSFEQLNPNIGEQEIERMTAAATECWERKLADALEKERNTFLEEAGCLPMDWDTEVITERARRTASEYMCGEFMVAALDAPPVAVEEDDRAALDAQHHAALRQPDGWKDSTWLIRVSPEMDQLARRLFEGESETFITYAGALFEHYRAIGRAVPSDLRQQPELFSAAEAVMQAERDWFQHGGVVDDCPPATGAMRQMDLGDRYSVIDVNAVVLEWMPDATDDVVRAYTRYLQTEFFSQVRATERRLIENSRDLFPLGPNRESFSKLRELCIEAGTEVVEDRYFTRGGFRHFLVESEKRQRHLRAMCAPDGWKRILQIDLSSDAIQRARKLFPGESEVTELFAACWLEHRKFRGLPLPESNRDPVDMDMSAEIFDARAEWLERHGR